MTDRRRVEDLLEDRPDFEAALEDVQEVDATRETWTFDDVPIDSGTFGQLVSEGVVEKVDGEYRLANPDAVRAAIDGEPQPATTEEPTDRDISLSLLSIDTRGAGLLAAVLGVLVAVRLFPFQSVFRDGYIVLTGNDPYYYRYWVEQTLANGTIGALPLGEVPEGIAGGEPFLVAALTWLAGLFGGGSGLALAIYPILSALVTGLFLYGLTLRVSADRRVALASVLMLAFTPSHALRTSLGFADHHAFDYVWLTLTAFALAVLLTGERDNTNLGRWLAATGLGVGVAGQVLAWDNGPLLVVPVAAVVVFGVLLDVRDDRQPLVSNAPLLAGLALAAVLTFAVHTTAGWHSATVAAVPALLFGGSGAVVAVGAAAARLDRSVRELAVVELVAGVGTIAAVVVFLPDIWGELQGGIDTILRSNNIAEVQSLFSMDTFGFLFLFGFVLVIAVPLMGWATVRLARSDDEWLVPVVYGWYFFGLAMFQVRFAGELSPFTALFSGLGFVWIASWVDLAEVPAPVDRSDWTDWWPARPDGSTVASVFLLFLLVTGLGVVQSGVKIQQITVDDDTVETATWLAEYSADRGWETESDSYVFSDWGRNRVYNYFVNGQSRSYGFAQSNYRKFIVQQDSNAAAATIDGRVRFLVTESFPVDSPAMGVRLHDHFGSRYENVEGLSRYRAIYATESGDRKAFLVVPGATLAGTAPPNTTVSLETDVDIPGASFTYERQVQTNASGNFTVDVAYPGAYELTAGDQMRSVSVSESGVMNGTQIAAGILAVQRPTNDTPRREH
ncbi:STT3 domain-containing protein [Salinibaculum rarum]|uniref:STT3 domain-containing protein n=1 Tax=Salinibaculum rarum TaxID=3058903 RepID=UPI00265EEDD4|nr:STT3 domain-containing protein [Salinibaculum sp. KK48]